MPSNMIYGFTAGKAKINFPVQRPSEVFTAGKAKINFPVQRPSEVFTAGKAKINSGPPGWPVPLPAGGLHVGDA
jgi:hypothetical protein